MDSRGRFSRPLAIGANRRGGAGYASPAKRHFRRRFFRTPFSFLRRWPRLTAFVTVVAAAAAWNGMQDEPLRAPDEAKVRIGEVLADLGFSFDQIVLHGHRFTSDTAIFDAIGREMAERRKASG